MTRRARTVVAQALVRSWQARGWVNLLLLPVAAVYAGLAGARMALYRLRWLRSERMPVPVVMVGNVIAGGAGKTPTVMTVVRHLQARGLRVGIASRGHGRMARGTVLLRPDTPVQEAGDEPLLLHRSTRAPTAVSDSRAQAVRALLEHQPDLDLVVCDDGLQHYALYRDLEICVFDDRGTGNGWLLPAGPLREVWPRRPLAIAGSGQPSMLVLHTAGQADFAGFRAERTLGEEAFNALGERVALQQLKSAGPLPLLALAGLARPQRFFDMLAQQGVQPQRTLAMPDHFATDELPDLSSWQIVCTEKDADKVWQRYPSAWAVPLIQTMEPAFWQALDAQIDRCLGRPLSSADGH